MNPKRRTRRLRCITGFVLAMTGAGMVAGAQGADPRSEYSPVVRDTTATNLYWGDTHLHTSHSADSFALGNEGIDGDAAFRFARGGTITASNGMQVRLRRPLDFLAVADHAEYLGVFPGLSHGDERFARWRTGQRWGELLRTGRGNEALNEFVRGMESDDPEVRVPVEIQRSIWTDTAKLADRYNEPGRFSAFIAYEWTSNFTGDNLHRVVLFRGDAERAARIVPFSAQESTDPRALWRALEEFERAGVETLAIPHNGNLSNGRMFAPVMLDGQPLTQDYARTRLRWEPVVEVTQLKGDSETHPALSPTDAFAAFERWDKANITLTAPHQPWMFPYEYARSALREGLRHESRIGANPFAFGMIGSSDIHNGYSAVAEYDFWGKYPQVEPSPTRLTTRMGGRFQEGWELGASGLAAVWAPENTREAIFAAFKRREVYGTTGSRIKLRFFGGWDYADDDVLRPNYAQIGYQKGVPMGGELLKAPAGKVPRFMVVAAKDPDEANLDRVQIIKGWLDVKGETHEKVYDVALSDSRRVDPKTGKAPAVGSTVDVKNASYTNSIGDPELATVWADPDFDARQRAFYYVRVLEIPKPRWTAYDAKFFNLLLPANIPMTVQDRAYSSPIWYQP